MDEYKYETYGDRIAEEYDRLYSNIEPESIEVLKELAGDGPALELGIGTGRVALPLQEKGVLMHGIDASEAMLSKLASKEGGADIKIQRGSFAAFEVEERFPLIYVVFNTFFALLTQEEQVKCFHSVSEHLSAEGVFLIEAFVPDMNRYIDHQTVRAVQTTEDLVQLDISRLNPLSQQVISQHVFLTEGGTRMYPVKLRYAWPSELDLMAQLAGLSLRHRWSSWTRDELTKESGKHISIYERAA